MAGGQGGQMVVAYPNVVGRGSGGGEGGNGTGGLMVVQYQQGSGGRGGAPQPRAQPPPHQIVQIVNSQGQVQHVLQPPPPHLILPHHPQILTQFVHPHMLLAPQPHVCTILVILLFKYTTNYSINYCVNFIFKSSTSKLEI